MEELLATLDMLGTSPPSISDSVWLSAKHVIASTFVSQKTAGNERPLTESDFADTLPTVEQNLQYLKLVLKTICNQLKIDAHTVDKDFNLSLLLLCGEHSHAAMWTTPQTVSCAGEILSILCDLHNCKGVSDLLTGIEGADSTRSKGLFKQALTALRPKLLKDTWKTYPAAVACYKWMLLQVKWPHLSDHLPSVLPTALMGVDDFEVDNRLWGVCCLHHIVENVTTTELCTYGREEVIYRALEMLSHTQEVSVLQAAVPCLIAVVSRVEGGAGKIYTELTRWSRWDDLMEHWLSYMLFLQNVELCNVYSDTLRAIVSGSGPGVVRWTSKILPVLQEYLEMAAIGNWTCAHNALKVLHAFLCLAWPVIPRNSSTLLRMLLHLLLTTTTNKPSETELLNLLEKCLTIVAQQTPPKQQLKFKDLPAFNDAFTQISQRALTAYPDDNKTHCDGFASDMDM